jgi:hypothetical protein
MQDKKKKNIKVRDLKPKKDAKGGMVTNVSTGTSTQLSVHGHQTQGRQINQSNRGT